MPVSRFTRLAGIPERTYRRRLARLRAGEQVKGPWPAPRVEQIEALAAKYDGHAVSTSTVERALRRRNLLLPSGYRADRKSWAVIRRRVFHDPPTERNRVWQTDFSEFETTSGGIWRISAVIDYVTKYCLAVTVTPTARGEDALACLNAAVARASEMLGLEDLRADRGTVDLFDDDGTYLRTVPAPIALVSDNGPCYRGAVFKTTFNGDDPLLRHVRTRVKSPQTNGVVERFFGTLKYEHLYRGHIADGDALAVEVALFVDTYNRIRPHQALGDRTPQQAYLQPHPSQNLPDS
jgi:putative transposase